MAGSRATASSGGFEENAMAILDSSGIKDSRDLLDDRAAFLEAVRSTCLAMENPSAPSLRMYDAVFQILQDSKSLELAIASFQLLVEMDKRYPRVYLTDSDGAGDLIVVKEAWSPFVLGADTAHGESDGSARSVDHLFDSLRFSRLIEDMIEAANTTDFEHGIKPVENMLLFQYLVNALEADFIPRHIVCKESLNWVLFRESLLNRLLGSRKLVFKALVKDCMSLLLKQYNHQEEGTTGDMEYSREGSTKSAHGSDVSLAFSVSELERRTLTSLKNLLVLVTKLDLIRKEADSLGLTSRTDGFRSLILEVILDELTYNISYVSPFLMAITEPKWKLDIILQYFSKYCAKPSVRTRRSDSSGKDLTLESVLNCFSTTTSTKAIVKKLTSEVAQLLLAHAYQVCLSLQHDPSCIDDSTKKIGATLLQISNNFISAFQNLRKVNEDIEISPFEKGALFTAATMARKIGK